jgi:hypothetical protein
MELNEFYTNEPLLEEFPSAFALVNHAIEVAKRRIRTGRVPDVYSENQNLAYEVLDDILEHQDGEEDDAEQIVQAVVEIPVIIEEEEPKAEKPKRQEFKRVAPRKTRASKSEDTE